MYIAFAQALSTSLVKVNFEACGLSDKEVISIADSLTKNNSLKTIILKNNNIRNLGVNSLF